MRANSLRICLTAALVACVGVASAAVDEKASQSWATRCAHCHLCEAPTPEEPCLKEYACPRHLDTDMSKVDHVPETAVLDQLEDLYVPVYFTHGKHARMAAINGGCATCHHYTPPNMPHPACRECHPASANKEDVEQPGLKGAYHRQCLGCHVEWDKSTDCEICHAKKAGGALHGEATTFCTTPHHNPVNMKDTIIFETEYDDGDKVPFHHNNHVHRYGGECAYCHQDQSCSQCHVHGADSHPMGTPDNVDLHDICYQCHDEERGCEQCHGRAVDDLFHHDSTGWPLRIYHSGVRCGSCHSRMGARFEKPSTECRDCHADGWDPERFNHQVTGVTLDETHGEADCSDCHIDVTGRRATCDECHDDGRTYDRRSGVPVGQEPVR